MDRVLQLKIVGLYVVVQLLEPLDRLGSVVGHMEYLLDDWLLDVPVDLGVGEETGVVVDFEEVGVQLLVQEDVEAQQLEAGVVGRIVPLGFCSVVENGLHGEQSLDHKVLDLVPELVGVGAQGISELLKEAEDGPFVGLSVLLFFHAWDEVVVLLVDREVGQVLEHVVFVALVH